MTLHHRRTFASLAVLVALWSGRAAADPPTRVARLAELRGSVSFSPAGEDEWMAASINRPLTTGDRLWVDADSRAEVQLGGAVIRLGSSTSAGFLNLDDRIAQVELAQGVLKLRVRRVREDQGFEIATPNLAFTIREPGDYRIEVDPDDDSTSVVVRAGQGEAYGEGAAYVVDPQQGYRFYGTGLGDYDLLDDLRPDDLERWASERDRRYDRSASARYVSYDAVGYEDLDANGAWRNEPGYGNVWVPARVASGWVPYRDGHWVWVDPWGWTWVDDEPWGFTVSHYGRWANARGTWVWIPGPVRSRAVYAPALVVFVGGNDLGAVAWFPLGPRDVYRPSYPVSRGYFAGINRSNTSLSGAAITTVYDRPPSRIVYANQQVRGAVVAVTATAFVKAQPVSRSTVQLRREQVAKAPVSQVAAVAPVRESVHGSDRAGGKPPARALERAVVARSAPPPARAGFAAQEQNLSAKPGRPLDDAERRELTPARPVQAPRVQVVAPAQAAAPKARPPPVAQNRDRGRNERGNDRPGDAAAPGGRANPPEPTTRAAEPAPRAAQPAPRAEPAPALAPGEVRLRPQPAERREEPVKPPVSAQPAPPTERRENPPAGDPKTAQPQQERKGRPAKATAGGRRGGAKPDEEEAKAEEERKREEERRKHQD